jgi:hypothetical protein
MAVEVLTWPDDGPGGRTIRWTQPAIRVHIELTSFPDWYVAEIRHALAWATNVTGVRTIEVLAGDADLTVVAGPGTGATTSAEIAPDWSLEDAMVRMGCCRVRPVWEDVLQAFGPLGDRADSRSVFSPDLSRQRPGCFDTAVLRTLYSLPPGSPPADVRSVARRLLAHEC